MIKKYIEFAIENNWNERIDGYKIIGLNKIGDYRMEGGLFYGRGNDIETITSKPFIEAVARGIEKTIKGDYVNVGKTTLYADDLPVELHFESIVNEITAQQAIAIRDNKLEEFITNILPGQN